jgi:hypothetical protein
MQRNKWQMFCSGIDIGAISAYQSSAKKNASVRNNVNNIFTSSIHFLERLRVTIKTISRYQYSSSDHMIHRQKKKFTFF